MRQAGLVWRTVRHLTARQLAYQVLTRLPGLLRRGLSRSGQAELRLPGHVPIGHFLSVPDADKPISWAADTFTFLNRSVDFNEPDLKVRANHRIDWNYAGYGKLWTYNLNYFDFLNQSGRSRTGMPDHGAPAAAVDSPRVDSPRVDSPGVDSPRVDSPGQDELGGLPIETGLSFIRAFIGQTDRLNDGLEPYPTSLRIINWIQFLSRHQIQDNAIDRHLYAQTGLLRRRLEYHIGGNHLLENAFALLTAALYFRHDDWYGRAAKLVRAELSAQVLADGGHDERSPMYHQILLDRLMDVLLAVKHDPWHNDPTLLDFLGEKATRMLGWLNGITFRNGDVPMVNDAAPGIAPATAPLRAKVIRAGVVQLYSMEKQPTSMDTGYRKFTFPQYELFVDVGAIGPNHQPGHAHADTFSFVLYVDNRPLIVDSGTSTYEIGPRRTWERSTAAHNTVDVMGLSSSEVWSGFRVGRRARVTVLTDTNTTLTARHDGYQHRGFIHERTWRVGPMDIRITDRLLETKTGMTRPQPGVARLHFHPDVVVSLAGTSIEANGVLILFESVPGHERPGHIRPGHERPAPELHLTAYEMADGFNRLRAASCVDITFTNYLETRLVPTR